MKKSAINLVVADMGYGHQRAAYPLLKLGGGLAINISDYQGMSAWEKKYWQENLESYEKISRFKKVPLLGNLVFAVMDSLQKIQDFYPFRDLSSPTIQQKYFYESIKRGLGKNLIERLNKKPRPLVTTFFVAAYIAEYHDYAGDIYCVVCDADASRAWAALKPKNSRIKFFVPSEKVKTRFLMYGVKPENIIISGFPLPLENIGVKDEIACRDLAQRIKNLDPSGLYQGKYGSLLNKLFSGYSNLPKRPLTITYAVGGAGAQAEIGAIIIKRLALKIKNKEIKVNLVAGARAEVKKYFEKEVKINGLKLGQGVEIIFSPKKDDYFKKFNSCLEKTDILWTKPSELSFYCALGLPIIMSSPVGSQEVFNREWLLTVGAGVDAYDAEYVNEWLIDLLKTGRLARAAVDAFLNAERRGVYNIARSLGISL